MPSAKFASRDRARCWSSASEMWAASHTSSCAAVILRRLHGTFSEPRVRKSAFSFPRRPGPIVTLMDSHIRGHEVIFWKAEAILSEIKEGSP